MEELNLEDIKTISVYLIDKNGNGYVGNIDTGFIALIAGLCKFYPIDDLVEIPISDIISRH